MKHLLYSALVTPFDDRDRLDFSTLAHLLENLQKDHDGVLLGGSTGEGDSLSEGELQQLFDFAAPYHLDRIVAVSEDCTAKVSHFLSTLKLPNKCKILLRVPSYYLPTQEGIFQHFFRILTEFKSFLFIIYNVPKRTGSKIELATLKRLSTCKNLLGIKDCTADFDFVRAAAKVTAVYCGIDHLYYDYLKAGASGLISVQSVLFSSLFTKIDSDYEKGLHPTETIATLTKLQREWSGFPNPIAIKMALKKAGYPSMNLRLPLTFPACRP